MQISPVNNICSLNKTNSLESKKEVKSFSGHSAINNYKNLGSIPASVYKANFMPSFGRYKKVKDVTVVNKDTGKVKNASLQRDVVGNTILYQLLIDKNQAGYMQIATDAIFPENDCILMEPDNNIPKVTYLRTLQGDKYKGIGTALIDAAVRESENQGKRGSLWLFAKQGYAWSLSTYRSNENPIPFYYKLGFESLNSDIDSQIRRAIQTSNDKILPSSTILLLPSSKANEVHKYYATHYTFDQD